MKRDGLCWSLALAVVCGATSALAGQAPIRQAGACDGKDLPGYSIRQARLRDPFGMLRWRKPGPQIATAIAGLAGKPYSFDAVNAVSVLIESKGWLPDNPDALAQIQYSDVAALDCRDGQLDVEFTVVSAAVSTTPVTLFEWPSPRKTPDQIAGLDRATAAWKISPEFGYDRAQGLSGGGRAEATWSRSGVPFSAMTVRGLASSKSHAASASFDGDSSPSASWLRRVDWQAHVEDASSPAADVHLDEWRLNGRLSAVSKPLAGVVARFAGIVGGGHQQSGFNPAELPAQLLAGTDFSSTTLAVGASSRGRGQSFAASYAVELGSNGASFHGDWRKQIADAAHEFHVTIGDHRTLDVEERLTYGRLTTMTSAPAGERFFGGAGADSLLLDDDWRIPANPFIRSIPTHAFSLDGTGGDRFLAYNSSTAVTIWRVPAVPAELTSNPAFGAALESQLTSARNTLDIVYQSADPAFSSIVGNLREVADTLGRIDAADAAARTSGLLPDASFRPCEQALRASRNAADHAAADRPVAAFGWVQELLPDGGSALGAVVAACGGDLVARLATVGGTTTDLASAAGQLDRLATTLKTRFDAIDTTASATRAEGDMAYARRALDVILSQLNVTSVSPVFVFDAAHMDPAAADPHGGTRFAVGGGIRLTLASTVNLTVTYAANPRSRTGEGSGALVFALTMRNLFE